MPLTSDEINKLVCRSYEPPTPFQQWQKARRYVAKNGYAYRTGWGAEHTLMMENILGRKLKKGESVHHKNGIRDDNDPQNLELWVGNIRYGQRATDLICPHCGEPYAT